MKRTVKTKVENAAAGKPLKDYLQERFTYHTPQEWAELIYDGRVCINGNIVSPAHPLQIGDIIEYHVQNIPEPDVDRHYRIIYEDDYLLAVDKPGNLPCHPAGAFFHNTLWAILQKDKLCLKPRFVSRLDRETSGVVLIAKTAAGHRRCQAAARKGQIQKIYKVMVGGVFPETLRARGKLVPDPESSVRKKQRFLPLNQVSHTSPDGILCETLFKRLETKQNVSMVEAELITGRQHQIRATLYSLGYPVVGDKLYGIDDTCFLRFIDNKLTETDQHRLRLDRQALHATELHFPHPHTGKRLTLTSPLPATLQVPVKTV
ncbi:MAG: RluA family pseudouridine synthase [Lentisphaeria bacterium]